MNTIDILGIIAGIMTTTCLVPQALQIHKTKHTKDISLGMYILFRVGVLLWLLYGLMKNDIAVVFANAITLPLAVLS